MNQLKHFSKLIVFLLLFAFANDSFAKELFTKEKIESYLTPDNPYFYKAIGTLSIQQSKEKSYNGAFDLQVKARYEKKDYPLSTATYTETKLSQQLYNGIELGIGYRKAEGLQEYNNIKTSPKGELLTTLSLPISQIFTGQSSAYTQLKKASLATQSEEQQVYTNILQLKKILFENYYQLLYLHELYKSEVSLLKKAEKNFTFVKKQVQQGTQAEIALLEIQSIVTNRKQRRLAAWTKFQNFQYRFVRYLGLTVSSFEKHYILPSLPQTVPVSQKELSFEVIAQRPEVKIFTYKAKALQQEYQLNESYKYPQLSIALQGVHDLEYKQDGYKSMFHLTFPLQQRSYKGKKEQLTKTILQIKSQQAVTMQNIEIAYTNLQQKINMQKQMIALGKEELQFVVKLQEAEFKKYIQGMSNLLFVNTREIKRVEVEQKLLQNYLTLQLLDVEAWYLQVKNYTK